MYITGACGALYDGASPDGSEDQSHITRVHQAYGRNYQLPNITAHNETCAAIGNVLWNWRMFLATGEAQYVDVLELALYNAVLSGVSLDGVDYFYVNPLRQIEPLPTELRWPRDARAVRHFVLLPAECAADDCRSQRLCVFDDRRRGVGQSLRRQHAGDEAQRQAAASSRRRRIIRGTATCGSRSTNVRRTSSR